MAQPARDGPGDKPMSADLTNEYLRSRFKQVVIPRYIEKQRGSEQDLSSGQPRFISVGGQPGSGKGRVLERLQADIDGSVVVNGDDLRQFHPSYARLMRDDPLSMPEVTGPAAGPWVGMSNEYLRGERTSAIVETTLRDAAMLQREFEAFRAAGFSTELHVVAVPLEVSRAGTVARFIDQVKDSGAGRWTPSSAHDVAAANVTDSVRQLVAAGVVGRVVIQDRDGQVFLDDDVRSGGAQAGEAAAGAVDFGRSISSLTQEQAADWCDYTKNILVERAELSQEHPVLDDRDLLKTAERLAGDAKPIITRAYPDDPRMQKSVAGEFEWLQSACTLRALQLASFESGESVNAGKSSTSKVFNPERFRGVDPDKGNER